MDEKGEMEEKVNKVNLWLKNFSIGYSGFIVKHYCAIL